MVAIDGPAGTGKSTVSRRVAERLGLDYLDTGAMYRGVTFAALRRGVDPEDVEAVARVAADVDLRIEPDRIVVDDVDATIEIRGPEVTRAVSTVAANPGVRKEMVSRQREWLRTRSRGGVIEGRDIGTVVFPDAPVKVFLTAEAEVRAGRRHHEITELEYEEVAADLARRDALDEGRALSPMASAPDAVVIDTTRLEVDEVVERVVALL